MALEIVARASRAGGGVNEDAAGATRRGMVDTAWVLDGATGLAGREHVPDGPTDAAWLVGALSQALRELDPGDLSPRDYFAQVIDRVGQHYRALVPDHAALPPYALPSAAGVWVRSDGDRLDLAFQGDCVAVVEQQGVVRCFGTIDLTGSDDGLQRMIVARQSSMPLAGPMLERLGDELRRRRARLNRTGGYWMLGTDVRAAAAMSIESFAARPGTRVLLCSDGYWRLVDHFRRYDAAGLLAASFEQGPDALLDQLRGLEAADADCRATARIKPMDDATALLLRF
ncbi:MAG TPA: hypothetical protein VGV37_03440 [Aliidongia sp.]|uniref:hypothetical protein n=1 Tax=Aliidongia sp. TaxID=1914230 RepID=UPI002DDD617E|nr:hypothetical protein [Aliidongia sp.]HEV2673569.1 hypothetical protein [Aliidongia sp.]